MDETSAENLSKDSSAEEPCGIDGYARGEDLPPFPPSFDVPIESMFTEESLNKFRASFARGPLNLPRFMKTVTELLNLESAYAEYMVPNLFNAIDTYRSGSVSFSDFCQYLYEDYQRKDLWKGELERMHLVVPGTVIGPKVHRPPPIKLVEVDDIHLMFSKDGLVSYWSNAFKIRKCRSLKTREIEKERHYGKVYCDIAVVESLGKVIVSTSDKEIQFFDLQSLEAYCEIHGLPSCACSLDAKLSNKMELTIVFGDWHGGVNVLSVRNAAKALRSWAERPKVLGIAATSLEGAISRNEIAMARWKVHNRRVDKVIFTELLGGQIISCSTDPNTALSIGCAFAPFSEQVVSQSSNLSVPRRPPGEEYLYKIPFGVQTIDIWEEKRYFAASGVDRIIRVWSIMTKGEAICTLRGHIAPIRQIKFYPPVLVSISSLKNIRVWDLKEFRSIISINSVTSKIRGQEVLFLHCSKISNVVLVQTSEDLFAFQLQKRAVDDESTATHSGAVVGGQYSDSLSVWITCSNQLVKIWDVRTGRKKSEFEVCSPSEALGEERINEELRFQADAALRMKQSRRDASERKNFAKQKRKYYPDFNAPNTITCMHVERLGNRLLTGHANGVLQEFNFVSGMNIRTMYKSHETKEGVFNSCINGVIYVKSALNDNILSVGWNKVIDVYMGGDSKTTEPVTSWNCFKGHEDDIWCVTSTEPNILVTGSYEGLVILWNFTSGKIEGRLLPPNYNPSVEYDMNKVTALCIYKPKAVPDEGYPVMYLFTAGPESGLHMWEIYWKIKIFFYRGRIRPWRSVTRYFCSLAAAPERDAMLAADSLGDIYMLDMKVVEPMRGLKYNPRGYEFNLHLRELMPVQLPEHPLQVLGVTTAGMPELIKTWPAHLRGVPVLSVCERYGLILSGDTDGKARVWNFCGHYVGMLGQDKEWDIYDPTTYLHPEVPREIQGDFSREYEVELDKRSIDPEYGDESRDVAAVHSVEDLDDYKMTDDEIRERARHLPVFKKALPDFLKFESCYKVVYRNCTHPQKYSLAPIYKRMFDSDLLERLPNKSE